MLVYSELLIYIIYLFAISIFCVLTDHIAVLLLKTLQHNIREVYFHSLTMLLDESTWWNNSGKILIWSLETCLWRGTVEHKQKLCYWPFNLMLTFQHSFFSASAQENRVHMMVKLDHFPPEKISRKADRGDCMGVQLLFGSNVLLLSWLIMTELLFMRLVLPHQL